MLEQYMPAMNIKTASQYFSTKCWDLLKYELKTIPE